MPTRPAESRKEGMRCRTTCGLGGGRRQATAAQAARRGGLDCRLGSGQGEERTWNMSSMVVTLEVSKLSGWLNANADCRESKGGRTMRGEVRAGRGKWRGKRRGTQRAKRARLQIGIRAGGEAHVEHVLHVCDVGGVKAQRLVERIRDLPRVKRRAYGAGRGAGREGEAAGDASRLEAWYGEERT
eukprot:scaffold16235_cov50-Phaeocystis_antarctica.AAC.2